MSPEGTQVNVEEKIDELLRFLDIFDKADWKSIIKWHGGPQPDDSIQFPYPEYRLEVIDFFQLAGQPFWSDYDYNPTKSRKWIEDPSFIKTASFQQIKTLLTYCVRGERFCDGHWSAMLEKGIITAILKRLEQIRLSE
jgi:hypothetical protein